MPPTNVRSASQLGVGVAKYQNTGVDETEVDTRQRAGRWTARVGRKKRVASRDGQRALGVGMF